MKLGAAPARAAAKWAISARWAGSNLPALRAGAVASPAKVGGGGVVEQERDLW